jgi:hypothetical protein
MYGNGKHGPLKINEFFVQVHKKKHKKDKFHFYGKFGHFHKDCLKCNAWFVKKGKPNVFI